MPRESKSSSNRGGNRGGGNNQDFLSTVRERPYAAAAAAAGVAAASAFLWSRRGQIGEAVNSGVDRLSELGSHRSQAEIGEEALTLKETGKKTKGPRGPIAQQDIRTGVATSNQEMKAGAKAFS